MQTETLAENHQAASAWHMPTAVPIQNIQDDNYRTKTFVLDAQMAAQPGQFVMAWLPRFDEKPFSLVNNDPVTLMITAVGPFSHLVHEQKVGNQLWLRGPFGQGFAVPHSHKRIALVGGGYGVAPLLWLARTQWSRMDAITTLIGARSAVDILYAERFHRLYAARPEEGADRPAQHVLTVTTEDASLGLAGRVTDALQPLLAHGVVDGIYACGPHGMLEALQQLGRDYAVPTQLSWEAYMRCGIGICGACEHNGRVLCLDGPVLRCDNT